MEKRTGCKSATGFMLCKGCECENDSEMCEAVRKRFGYTQDIVGEGCHICYHYMSINGVYECSNIFSEHTYDKEYDKGCCMVSIK
jgi:hypothetical protein